MHHQTANWRPEQVQYHAWDKLRLLDNLVGVGEQRRWHVEAERLRGLEVDDEFEFHRLLDRQVGRLFASENPRDVATGEAIRTCLAGSIAHQPTNVGKLAQKINCGHRMTRRQADELITPTHKQ